MNLPAPRLLYGLTVAVVLASLVGCAAQNLNSDGMKLIENGQRTEGLALLARASELEPTNSRYRMDYLMQQAIVVRGLLARADEARAAGNFNLARELYVETLSIHPGDDRARRGLAAIDMDERHRVIVADADKLVTSGDLAGARHKLRQVLLENSSNAGAQRLLAQVNERVERADESARQKVAAASVLKQPVTLQFRDANVRMVFEALSRTTGLNVIFDRDVRADLKTTIFVRDASVGDTVDLILLQNQLEKKILNANTLFIYPATGAKHKEYQELKVRTFQISNADAKHLQNVLKTVLKVKDIALDERTNTLVIRDSVDAIAVAEKVIAAHDFPDAEVIIEVEVLEVARDRLADIGILWPDSVTLSTPSTADTLGAMRDLTSGQLLITPLSATLNLKLVDTDANLLASPRIRARHKEKARIMIGDKVPVITNAVTPIQTGSAVVTGTVQYLDVGIKLEIEPHVYAEGDVGIKLNLEVSNIVKEVRNLQSGTLAYQIGTRSAQTHLRLGDGETQILGGLISELDRSTAARVPGLGQLPVLGRLFSNQGANVVKTEIILSITPRIVRRAATADASLRDVYSGTDAMVRQVPLRLDPLGSVGGAASPSGGMAPTGPRAARPPMGRSREPAAAGTGPAVSAPASDPPATSGAKAPASGTDDSDEPPNSPTTSPAPSAPADPIPPTTDPNKPKAIAPAVQRGRIEKPAAPAATNQRIEPDTQTLATAQVAATEAAPNSVLASGGVPAELALNAPGSVSVGEEFDVLLEATIHEPVRTLPLVIRFDPQVLSFVGARPEALAQAGGITSAAPKVDALTGRLDVELQTPPDTPMSGQGRLLNLRFAAKSARAQTRITLGPITLPGSDGPRTIPRPRTLLVRVGQ